MLSIFFFGPSPKYFDCAKVVVKYVDEYDIFL